MRRLASLLAILLLLSTAVPLLACMTDAAMSRKESACCQAMHGRCDGMEKMGCCRSEIRTDEHPQLAASASVVDLHLAVVEWLRPLLAGAQKIPASPLATPEEYSPPGLVTARTTVLRI